MGGDGGGLLGAGSPMLFFALRRLFTKFMTRSLKPTVEAHQAALSAASGPKSFEYLDRFRLVTNSNGSRNQEESDRCVVRLSLNMSGLEQTIRFLGNKVVLFPLDAPSSQAGARNAQEST
jgi:hypothetical protein